MSDPRPLLPAWLLESHRSKVGDRWGRETGCGPPGREGLAHPDSEPSLQGTWTHVTRPPAPGEPTGKYGGPGKGQVNSRHHLGGIGCWEGEEAMIQARMRQLTTCLSPWKWGPGEDAFASPLKVQGLLSWHLDPRPCPASPRLSGDSGQGLQAGPADTQDAPCPD